MNASITYSRELLVLVSGLGQRLELEPTDRSSTRQPPLCVCLALYMARVRSFEHCHGLGIVLRTHHDHSNGGLNRDRLAVDHLAQND
jgi:hypothetical protein